MKIRLYSDLHFEFAPFTPPEHPDDAETVCVLAGDIWTKGRTLDAVRDWAHRFRAVLLVLGNHDFWGGSLTRTPAKVKEQLAQAQQAGEMDNVHLLDCTSIILDDTAFVGATLWTDFSNKDPLAVVFAEGAMRDFKKIRTGPAAAPYSRHLRAGQLAQVHQHTRRHIEKAIRSHREQGYRVVVISHHVPSFRLVHPWHRDDPCIGAYASDFMDTLPEDALPHAWILGHQHESALCRHRDVVCMANPRGYAGMAGVTNPCFDTDGFGVELGRLPELAGKLPPASETLFPAEIDDEDRVTITLDGKHWPLHAEGQ